MRNEMSDTNVRIQNARDHMTDLIANAGGNEMAEQVLDHYIKQKLVKLDMNIGRYQLKHGALLESAVIHTAIEFINTGEWL